MANNTLNPMPSSNPLDFFDNSENLDLGMNSTAETFFLDRFGRPRNTYQAFHNLVINAKNEVAPTVAAAKEAVNAVRDDAIEEMQETAADLGADLNNKHASTYAQLAVMTQNRDGVVGVVDADPDQSKNGWYYWNNATKVWMRFQNQPVFTVQLTAAELVAASSNL